MRTYITKAQAFQLAGHWRNDLIVAISTLKREGRLSGELFCCDTGAKIYIAKVGAVWRYYLSGYAQNGRDVAELVERLKTEEVKYRLVREDGVSSRFFDDGEFESSWPYNVARKIGFKVPPGMKVELERTVRTKKENGKTAALDIHKVA